MVDALSDYLDRAQNNESAPVFQPFDPDELFHKWNKKLDGTDTKSFSAWADQVIDDSIQLHNPRYMGHQVSPVLPQAAMVDFMSALLNNGVGVYEMGSPTVAMERAVVKQLALQLGFDDKADGILTSGGTLGNMTALLAARQLRAGGDTWNEGTRKKQLAVMVSEEAHYCIERAVHIMGWGEQGIVKVPIDDQFRLDVSKLHQFYEEATRDGKHIIGVIGSACSTATGSFDPLVDIADFCEEKDLWFHVDAAHGGAAIFSEKHRHLLEGVNRADSVIVDFHKMLMCPALVTGLVFKDGDHSYQTFAQKAEYLWADENREWFNLGKRTFECTKNMMALKVYSIFHQYGTELFKENVEQLFSLAEIFSEEISKRNDFELLTQPKCNIVCFRHKPNEINHINSHNAEVRKKLINNGKYFIVQTNIDNQVYLRISLMNPFTTKAHLTGLFEEIEAIAADL